MSDASVASTGFRRGRGCAGVRNRVLVLPSVVCSTHAASEVARTAGALTLTHQHGCLHVGDDLHHTERALIAVATSPNVGGVVVMSLGCETIQGRRLARRIRERGQRVRFVGIQQEGGTTAAIEQGRAAVAELAAELTEDSREPLPRWALAIGIDADAGDALVGRLHHALQARGVLACTAGRPGAEGHVELAARGAALIVSLLGGERVPIGFAASPVLAVSRDNALHEALRDDFDLAADGPATTALAERVADAALTACEGKATAAERRGAHDLVLRRLAMTM